MKNYAPELHSEWKFAGPGSGIGTLFTVTLIEGKNVYVSNMNFAGVWTIEQFYDRFFRP